MASASMVGVPRSSFLPAPVQAFFAWLMSPLAPAPVAERPTPLHGAEAQSLQRPACVRKPSRPARVVRVHRGPHRLVISGRMSDVCAELDRLAALETAST